VIELTGVTITGYTLAMSCTLLMTIGCLAAGFWVYNVAVILSGYDADAYAKYWSHAVVLFQSAGIWGGCALTIWVLSWFTGSH